MIEIGKMHKLRILLRNETVSWVDTFIADGGMDEIVQLIYRIMKVEWRCVLDLTARGKYTLTPPKGRT
jgi:hypothetical protein